MRDARLEDAATAMLAMWDSAVCKASGAYVVLETIPHGQRSPETQAAITKLERAADRRRKAFYRIKTARDTARGMTSHAAA